MKNVTKIIMPLLFGLVLGACGGTTETSESFRVALTDLSVNDVNGNAVDVDVSQISQTGKLAAK